MMSEPRAVPTGGKPPEDHITPPSEMPARVLGLDPGARRIGVAVSDPTGTIATPLATIENRGEAPVLSELRRLLRDTQADGVVVGLPVRTDGREGPEAQAARAWAERLARALNLPVALWDERLTTAGAERALIESGVRREKRRSVIDQAAAQWMLQSFLDARAPAPPD